MSTSQLRNLSRDQFETTPHHKNHSTGFTLIELMIVIAVIAILLALAIPTYSNYSIRARIAEGLSIGMAAKTAVSSACLENPTINPITNSLAGYDFIPGGGSDDFVSSVQLDGPCTAPVITVTMANTGTWGYDPILAFTGDISPDAGQVRWTCRSSNTPNTLLPDTCRS